MSSVSMTTSLRLCAILLAFLAGIHGAHGQDAEAPTLQYGSPADIARVKTHIVEMMDNQQATEQDIDTYVKSQGYTAAELKASAITGLSPVGRWQVIALPTTSASTEPSAILLDTMTGQTWDYACVLSPMPGYPLACRTEWLTIPVSQPSRPAN